MKNVIAFVLRLVFPDRWVNDDTVGAVLAIAVVTLACTGLAFLAGCHGGAIYAKPYHHNSSIPDNRDTNTSDRFGLCAMYYLAGFNYAPQMHVCIDREWTSKPVFGSEHPDIVGDVQIHAPLYMWGRK